MLDGDSINEMVKEFCTLTNSITVGMDKKLLTGKRQSMDSIMTELLDNDVEIVPEYEKGQIFGYKGKYVRNRKFQKQNDRVVCDFKFVPLP